MTLFVGKTGLEMIDALGAQGLTAVVAQATQAPVLVQQQSFGFRITNPEVTLPDLTPADIFDQILAIPTLPELESAYRQFCERNAKAKDKNKGKKAEGELESIPLDVERKLDNLDGWLAVLFTTPGKRVASLADLFAKQSLSETALAEALQKVETASLRRRTWLENQVSGRSKWLSTALQKYENVCSDLTELANYRAGEGTTFLLTLDPAASYATRRTISDTQVSHKTNLGFAKNNEFGWLFVLIGGVRFLRAQRVSTQLVNLYVGVPNKLWVAPCTRAQRLNPLNCHPQRAVLLQSLARVMEQAGLVEPAESGAEASLLSSRWSGLAYQTLQTQGAQQSISVNRGYFDFAWLEQARTRGGTALLKRWYFWLSGFPEQAPLETSSLESFLISQQGSDWLDHLKDWFRAVSSYSPDNVGYYSLKQLKEVTNMTDQLSQSPEGVVLSKILERKEGTLHFGQLLHQLGRYNRATLRDLLEEGQTAEDWVALLEFISSAVQQFAQVKPKYQFIGTPTLEDFRYLLADVEEHGVKIMPPLLGILAFLFYPADSSKNGSDQTTSPVTPDSDPEEEPTEYIEEQSAEDEWLEHFAGLKRPQ